VTVAIGNQPPVIKAAAELTGPEMETMTCTVTGSDPDEDYPLIFSYSESALPSLSYFDPIAENIYELSWQPTYDDAGDYTVTFTVTDAQGLSITHDLVIHVTDVNRSPVLDPVDHQHVSETNLLEFSITGIDPDGDPLDYAAGPLPQGASFDTNTRIFSWTPTYDRHALMPMHYRLPQQIRAVSAIP